MRRMCLPAAALGGLGVLLGLLDPELLTLAVGFTFGTPLLVLVALIALPPIFVSARIGMPETLGGPRRTSRRLLLLGLAANLLVGGATLAFTLVTVMRTFEHWANC